MVFGFDITTFLFLALPIGVLAWIMSVNGKGRKMTTVPSILPIRSAVPEEMADKPLLLHCPSQGGWHVGVWHEGKWVDRATRTVELHPDFYMESPPPLDERGELSRPWMGSTLPEKIRNVALWIIIFLLVLALVTLFQNPAPGPVR